MLEQALAAAQQMVSAKALLLGQPEAIKNICSYSNDSNNTSNSNSCSTENKMGKSIGNMKWKP